MIIEIEYYKGDVLLTGTTHSTAELKRQIAEVGKLYDRECDNFTELLCRMFNWTMIQTDEFPDYVYDRDTEILRKCRQKNN